MKICPKCFKEHQKQLTFCSRSCANSRKHSEETKRLISKSLTKKQLIEKICEECKNIFFTKAVNQRYCSLSCKSTTYGRENKEFFRKHFTKVANKRHSENDPTIGWQNRYKFKPSYPEQYFINLFNNEKIEYKREVKCGKYFIDFVLPGKIALEIDGRRHDDPEIVEKDILKDKLLKSNNYKIFRIKWINPVSEISKEKLYKQINALLVTMETRVFGKDEISDHP